MAQILPLFAGEMHTPTGKVLAQERKRVVEEFVDQFMKEWEGDTD